MKNYRKYAKQYFLPKEVCRDWVARDALDEAPVWCSVDLRDGNQALVEPMSLATKVEFFRLLTELGFKEIEVGFPAASETEFAFVRKLIEEEMIPDDVTIQVLTQAREKIIRRTFDALAGAKNAIVHVYNSVSPAQRKQVFHGGRDEVKKISTDGARLINELAKNQKGRFRLEYSPESFTAAEPDFALEVCNAVLDEWKPSADKKAIINLPATVETALPHVFAQQVEFMRKNLVYPEAVVLSVHPHNDRGCGVAAAEAGLLAGAGRVEGTLFGNGERTGNVDLVTLALNLFSHGVDPKLNFENLPYTAAMYSYFTGMKIPARQPYAGEMVFAAFAGSHQDAIAKGMRYREKNPETVWNVPYLPIDPRDIGREYEKYVIRINSQSGKGGVAFILESEYELHLPARLKEAFSQVVKNVSDKGHKELKASELYELFLDTYLRSEAYFSMSEVDYRQNNGIDAEVLLTDKKRGVTKKLTGHGNGRLDAVSNILQEYLGVSYTMNGYEQHALSEGKGTSSKAITYLSIGTGGTSFWGAGVHDDSNSASVRALCAAINNFLASQTK